LVADANTGWTRAQDARVVCAVSDVDVYIEQPCLTYEECLAVRRQTPHPFVLDENIDDLGVLLRARHTRRLALEVMSEVVEVARREGVRLEKIGGTVHLALGRSYPETGGRNESALHWDLICDLREGGKLTADGAPLLVDGQFVAPA
jgi:hypothetical protein